VEAVQKRPATKGLKNFASTRRGAYTIAAISAALAGLILLVFINNYKDNVDAGLAPAPVLTADRLIPKGTAGNEVLSQKLFRPVAIAEQDLKAGAITDSAALTGTVAVRDILPGQQITAADFTAGADPIRSRLTGTERAVQIPVDKIHGLLGTLRVGDRVDILAAFNSVSATDGTGTPALRPLIRGVRVMAISSGSVILETTDREGAALAFAADNAKLWFLLRPPVGAEDSKSLSVTEDSLASQRPFVANGAEGSTGGSK
jgi:Flp pilus assembly protein CpaB